MSAHIPNSECLVDLLKRYAEKYRQGTVDEALTTKIRELVPRIVSPLEFQTLAGLLWSKIAPWYDIDTMIQIFRRWLELEPTSKDAKGALGMLLLLHGPDWDEEGHSLINDAKALD